MEFNNYKFNLSNKKMAEKNKIWVHNFRIELFDGLSNFKY